MSDLITGMPLLWDLSMWMQVTLVSDRPARGADNPIPSLEWSTPKHQSARLAHADQEFSMICADVRQPSPTSVFVPFVLAVRRVTTVAISLTFAGHPGNMAVAIRCVRPVRGGGGGGGGGIWLPRRDPRPGTPSLVAKAKAPHPCTPAAWRCSLRDGALCGLTSLRRSVTGRTEAGNQTKASQYEPEL
jgi:hypothetical protein